VAILAPGREDEVALRALLDRGAVLHARVALRAHLGRGENRAYRRHWHVAAATRRIGAPRHQRLVTGAIRCQSLASLHELLQGISAFEQGHPKLCAALQLPARGALQAQAVHPPKEAAGCEFIIGLGIYVHCINIIPSSTPVVDSAQRRFNRHNYEKSGEGMPDHVLDQGTVFLIGR